MERRTVNLRIGDQSFTFTTTSDQDEAQRLADLVGAKLAEIAPRGAGFDRTSAQAMALTAMALAYDLEAERARHAGVESRSRALLEKVVAGIDDVLAAERPEV